MPTSSQSNGPTEQHCELHNEALLLLKVFDQLVGDVPQQRQMHTIRVSRALMLIVVSDLNNVNGRCRCWRMFNVLSDWGCF
jgi:hypothetical protein